MGKTQKAVTELFGQTIAEHAQAGPTFVLLDEVETLAVDRNKLSLEAIQPTFTVQPMLLSCNLSISASNFLITDRSHQQLPASDRFGLHPT
jgi:hypothetical protein